jgi:isoleucyl-tRNA synthetase
MALKYKEYQQLNLPAIEEEVLARWDREKAFEQSIQKRSGAKPFVFFEGPPSANGMPGIHHVISRTLKDLVCRYKTMQGFQVKRKGGWDTHGLPVELGVEKELGITKEDIGKKISIEAYNLKCREAVLRYKKEWDDLTRKMGYWVDLKDPYITFDNNYIESLWWMLKKLYQRGYLYESVSIQPYSPAAGTGLSSHELNQPGTYKDVKDTSVVAMFKAQREPSSNFLFEQAGTDEVYFLAWTTTPWTLPSNLGLTVGASIQYVSVRTFNPYTLQPCVVVLAENLLGKYFDLSTGTGNWLPKGSLPEKEAAIFSEETWRNAEEIIASWIENSDATAFSSPTELLQKRLEYAVQKEKKIPYSIISRFTGEQLEGLRYEQLLPYPANTLEQIRSITPEADPFRILCDAFVTTEDGTGIVHTSPAFGADDYKVGKKYGIGILTLVDREGKFVDGLGPFSNRYVKNYKDEKDFVDVNVDISIHLKKSGLAFKVEKYEHNYPHCWRTDKPILYYPLDAWFIKTTALKNRMVDLNKTIQWKPASTGTGRFGNWLENMVDWNLSRSRYWGTPLPIWKTIDEQGAFLEAKDGGSIKCIGAMNELVKEIQEAQKKWGEDCNKGVLEIEEGTGKISVKDLHKPYVDEIVLVDDQGRKMRRVPDLIDVWFDSGAMPYAQWHFPFENREEFAQNYPADFIAEGVDQTRGWFYTLHALGALLKEDIQETLQSYGLEANDAQYPGLAYKTVVSNGLVLDKNGNKMSKRLGNVVNPFETIAAYGADATRWYLITNASPWESMKFDVEGIKEVQRKFFGTLYNTYQFFALYANVDGFCFKEKEIPVEERPEIDQWIISSLYSLVKEVQRNMDDYEPTQAGRLIETFVDEHLSNWYVRLCRRRFWKGEYEADKIAAYQTLYECLEVLSLLIAPVSPFFAEWLFTNLNQVTNRIPAESVHHALFPVPKKGAVQPALEERMQMAQDISSLILSLRKKVNIKVRQPLQKVLIPALTTGMKEQIQRVEELIKAEVNVKEFQFITESDGFIKKRIKPNFVVLGKKLGAKMKLAAESIGKMTQEEIAALEKEGQYTLQIEGEPLILQINEVEITSEDIPGWMVASKGALTVALDVTVTPELEQEGNARELVNRIQKIRKDNNYELTDRILVKTTAPNETLQLAIQQYKSYITTEILADELDVVMDLPDGTEIEVNDVPLKVFVTKKE